MKQVLIQKNDQIKELSGSRIEFYKRTDEEEKLPGVKYGLSVDDREVTKVSIPFAAKILSGGTLDLDFTLSENAAAKGISLLGAYWDGKVVTAYLRAVMNLPQFIAENEPILVGTLVQVTTMKQIETDMLNGVVEVAKSGQAIVVLDNKPSKRTRARRKDAR